MPAALVRRLHQLARMVAVVITLTAAAIPAHRVIDHFSGLQEVPGPDPVRPRAKKQEVAATDPAPPPTKNEDPPVENWSLSELFELGRTPAPVGDATHQYGKEGAVIRVEGFLSKVLATHGESVVPNTTDCKSAPGARLYITEGGEAASQQIFIALIDPRVPSLESCPDKLAELAQRRAFVRLQGILVVHPVPASEQISRMMIAPLQRMEVCTGTRASCSLGLDWKTSELDVRKEKR